MRNLEYYLKYPPKYYKEAILLALLILTLAVGLNIWRAETQKLSVHFLDVGQGDAIFVETPSGKQLLVDGGKNKKVVSELGRLMSFGDRTIDIVIATHPDADHIGGLPEVFSRYDVAFFIEPGVKSQSDLDETLSKRVREEGVQKLIARKGQIVDFGDGAALHILFPDKNVEGLETNDASIVAKLVFGQRSFLLTGDAGIKTENILLGFPEGTLDADVLKVGHHGSRTSTSLPFAREASPIYAIISAGKDNSYGHPHREVINILNSVGAKIKSTAESSTLHFITDGETIWLR